MLRLISCISLPGGRTLPPPLVHVFRSHIRRGDAELIVQLVARDAFEDASTRSASTNRSAASGSSGEGRELIAASTLLRASTVVSLNGFVFQLGEQCGSKRRFSRFDVGTDRFGAIHILSGLNAIAEIPPWCRYLQMAPEDPACLLHFHL